MKLFNKHKIKLSLIVAVMLFVSCEDWLSVGPGSEIKYDEMFSSKNGFKDQITGVYTALSSETLYGANMTYGMMDALGQQYVWSLPNGNFHDFSKFEYNSVVSTSVINSVWSTMYNTIANINILLQGVEEYGDVLTDEERRLIEGEAYALRAFLHFDLLRIFGKSYSAGSNEKAIPYVSNISKNVTPMSTVSEIIDLVLQDLIKAESLMKNDPIATGNQTDTFFGNRDFRFNYYAVRALMARVYLYKNDKPNALENAKFVIESARFPWTIRERVTTPTRENRDGIFSSEAIFTLNNTALETLTGKYLREGLSSDKNNLLTISGSVLNQIYESDFYGGFDWRYNYYFEIQSNTLYGSSKLWQYSLMPKEYANRQPLIRVSEMYLIAAETESNRSNAVSYLNTLRNNRGIVENFDLDENVTETILINEIVKEYRKEFVGEGQWFFLCKRLNFDNLPNVVVPFNRSFYVLPIPTQEIEYGNR